MTIDQVSPTADQETLAEIQDRVLWLATRIVDVANNRGKTDIEVGGHHASSASLLSPP